MGLAIKINVPELLSGNPAIVRVGRDGSETTASVLHLLSRSDGVCGRIVQGEDDEGPFAQIEIFKQFKTDPVIDVIPVTEKTDGNHIYGWLPIHPGRKSADGPRIAFVRPGDEKPHSIDEFIVLGKAYNWLGRVWKKDGKVKVEWFGDVKKDDEWEPYRIPTASPCNCRQF